MTSLPPRSLDGVAIIGMAGRFPGAGDLAAFWHNLCDGVESISFFTDAELRAAGVPPQVLALPSYVKAAPVLADVDRFDAAFFGISPRDAALADPQQRLFLECAWAAFEDAGYDPRRCRGPVGVFAGARLDSYLLANLWPNLAALADLDPLQVLIGNDKDYLATQVSYRLDLRGPSIGVQTACSTSLVAVSLACQSLLLYQSDLALAGGVSVRVPQTEGYFHAAGGILSSDGHCRAFDAAADGTLFGSGVGAVVLKRLDEAQADGDHVYAAIKGVAVNNDGAQKVGYTAPGPRGQAEVIAMAQAAAGVSPRDVTFVEAHGTGTALGDPVEVDALAEVFRAGTSEKGFCALGAVKTNVGHLDTAAGIAGLLKAALALRHRRIPPTLHFTRPNPRIDFAGGPFYVNTRLRDWETDRLPRRAGVSSFGIGGTNAHAVLEEAPAPSPSPAGRRWQLLPLSAQSEEALAAMSRRLAARLGEQPDLDLADAAFTLQEGRRRFAHRQALVCDGLEDAAAALSGADPRRLLRQVEEREARPVVFLFPGQGAQYAGMGAGLYRELAVFRDEIDRCSGLLGPHLEIDLRALLVPVSGGEERARQLLARTAFAQPALFAVEYALARLWMSWGLQPVALAGHSVGEYVAACLAGTFSLADALLLVAERGRLMQEMPEGAMLAVPLPADELARRLPDGVAVAALNAPRLTVVAGPPAAIEELRTALEAAGVRCRRLRTDRAFHSPAVEPLLGPFAARLEALERRPPRLPFLSNLTGGWISAAAAADPAYWVRHLRQPVRFGDNLAELLREPDRLLLEIGPGRTLATLAKRHPGFGPRHAALACMPAADEPRPEVPFLLGALGRAWTCGVTVDWRAVHGGERRRRVPLPTYPFARERHWLEPPAAAGLAAATAAAAARTRPLAECFRLPVWQQSMAPAPEAGWWQGRRWLVLGESGGLAGLLGERLAGRGEAVVTVEPGAGFARLGDGRYRIDPWREADHAALFRALGEAGEEPAEIVCAWTLGLPEQPEQPEAVAVSNGAGDLGFASLLHLARALGAAARGAAELRLHVLATGLAGIAADDAPEPLRATLLGPARVIPQEYPGIACRVIDVAPPRPWESAAALVDCLLDELASGAAEPLVAYRGTTRWVRVFAPLRLEARDGLPACLQAEGVCLITGGLGGIGLALAHRLAAAARSRLVLLGRSPLPPREEWQGWLAAHGEADPASRKIRGVLALEGLGSEVMTVAADVADRGELSAALALARTRFGRIQGVIHAAGVPGGGILQRRTAAAVEAVLAPKVAGALLLDELLAEDRPDFFVLCSSTVAFDGGAGQADYCAANAFLDAFAHWRRRRGLPAIAINWGEWEDVGMAAAARAGAARDAGDAARTGTAAPMAAPQAPRLHPLLARRAASGGGREVYAARLDARSDWVLAEHRLAGEPVLPGTAYLELARAALAASAELAGRPPIAAVELRDVYFIAPLRVPEGGTAEVSVLLEEEEAGELAWSVRSGGAGAPEQQHAMGRIRALKPWARERRHLGELLQRCGTTATAPPAFGGGPVWWGPRWQSLRHLYLGDGEGLALLELPAGFAAETAELALHPALLDVATGCCIALIGEEGLHLPFSYGRLRLQGSLPARLYSHFVRREGAAAGRASGVAIFDVTLLDESGTEVARIDEFALRRSGLPPPAAAGRETTAGVAPPPRAEHSVVASARAPGLRPAEGTEALLRVLARVTAAQVVVSRLSPAAATAAGGAEIPAPAPAAADGEGAGAAASAAPAPHRRGVHTAYVPPRNEMERAIAETWAQMLGFERIGIHDDFFELGGHSVLALQLVARLRESFGVELPLDVLFEAATVAQLAEQILRRLGEGTAALDLGAALDEIAGLSDDEVSSLLAAQTREEE